MTVFTARTPRGHAAGADLINQIANPSFETTGDFWADAGWGYTNDGGGSFVGRAADSFAFTGAYSLLKQWNKAPGSGAGAGIYTIVNNIKPGDVYTASAFMSTNYTDQQGQIYFEFYNGGTVSGSYAGSVAQLGNSWTRVSATATAPSGTTAMRVYVRLGGQSIGRADLKLRIDAVMLTPGPNLLPYFDGDTPTAADGRAYGWGGTPHASNSYSYPPDPATNVLPDLYQRSYRAPNGNSVYELLGGGVALVLRGAGAPVGTLSLFFHGDVDPAGARAKATSAFEAHRGAGTWIIVDDKNPQLRMQYVVNGDLELRPTDDARSWWLDIPFRKLSDA